MTDLDADADFEYHVQEHARMHELEGYEADHHLDETDLEMIDYAHDLEQELPIDSPDYHWGDVPVVPVHHKHPKAEPTKQEEEKPAEEAEEVEEEQESKKPAKKETSRYRVSPEKADQGD